MHKGLIVFIAVTAISTVVIFVAFMTKSADKANEVSNSLLQEFKTVEKDLKKSTTVIDSLNRAVGVFDSVLQK